MARPCPCARCRPAATTSTNASRPPTTTSTGGSRRGRPRRWSRRQWSRRPCASSPPMAEIEVLEADITTLEVDAIANAANTGLMHGGGVAGAIARAAGPELQRESERRAPIGLGEAVETTAGQLPARWVIHAATMELGGPTSADIIRRATAATLWKADELGARSLALVAFGTGVGGFPVDEAAEIEVDEVRRHLASGSRIERIVFAVRGAPARAAFDRALSGSENR